VSAQVSIEAHLHRADIVEDLEESGRDDSGHVQDDSSHVQEGISEKSKTQKHGKISLKDAINNA
jgi:hypothetical protein